MKQYNERATPFSAIHPLDFLISAATTARPKSFSDGTSLTLCPQVLWDDIVGEPEGLRTPDGCWNCSIKCYDGTRRCCYVLLVVLFAPFIACCNGCQFACLAFNVSTGIWEQQLLAWITNGGDDNHIFVYTVIAMPGLLL